MRLNQDFIAGARATTPILIGVIPFAMITGVGAVNVGMTMFEAMGMSVIVFAGASQLVVFQLMTAGSPWIIMVLTAWVVNLRFSMYSATLAPHLQKLSTWQKALLAYMLSDQAFGVSLSHFVTEENVSHRWFYFGSALTIWVAWQLSALSGALVRSAKTRGVFASALTDDESAPPWGRPVELVNPLPFFAALNLVQIAQPTVQAEFLAAHALDHMTRIQAGDTF